MRPWGRLADDPARLRWLKEGASAKQTGTRLGGAWPPTVNALNIRQPWAWVINGGKALENRRRTTSCRGPGGRVVIVLAVLASYHAVGGIIESTVDLKVLPFVRRRSGDRDAESSGGPFGIPLDSVCHPAVSSGRGVCHPVMDPAGIAPAVAGASACRTADGSC